LLPFFSDQNQTLMEDKICIERHPSLFKSKT
jgi:hypothetical protein